VVNAEGTTVIFERHRTSAPNDIKLYSLDLSTGDVQPFVTFASTRADWCWDRSGGQLRSGPVAFSNNNGIWTVATGGQPVRLHNTAGMVYPSWYPDCEHLAVDVTGPQVTAEIDATTGIQHPKWFPPREDGKTLLIAAVQAPGQPFRIATFDVSLFVGGAH